MNKTGVELMMQKILGQLVAQNGQEIYIISGQKPMMRKFGYLLETEISDIITEDSIKNIVDIVLSDDEVQFLNKHKNITVVREIGSIGRFRVRCYFQRKSLSVVFRNISNTIPKFDNLILPESVRKIPHLNEGLVVISGPYDSGKSTLIASILQYILDNKKVRVMTIEKPLEYILIGGKGLAEQREVGVDVSSFEEGLDMLFEDDVDVIYVSDISSADTLSRIISLSSMKLVFLHITSDSTVEALESMISLAEEFGKYKSFSHKLSKHLSVCLNLRLPPTVGRTGRIYAFEILINTSPVKIALKDREFDRIENILQLSSKEGMKTLDQHLFELVQDGKVDKKDAAIYFNNPDKFKSLIA